MSNMLCRAKLQPPHGKEVEHTFRWSVRRVPWHRVRDAHHMQPVTRETRSSQAKGTQRQLKCHRFYDGLSCPWDGWRGRREEDDLRRKFQSFSSDAVAGVAT